MSDDRTMIPSPPGGPVGMPDPNDPHRPWTVRDEVLVEQYKVYTELTMRITELRYKTNQFHAATNFVIVSAIGTVGLYALEQRNGAPLDFCAWRAFPIEILIVMGMLVVFGVLDRGVWGKRIENAKALIGFRFTEIDKLEKMLPARPYAGEYEQILAAKQSGKYSDFTDLEGAIPRLFAIFYALVVLGIVALIAIKIGPIAEALGPYFSACEPGVWSRAAG